MYSDEIMDQNRCVTNVPILYFEDAVTCIKQDGTI